MKKSLLLTSGILILLLSSCSLNNGEVGNVYIAYSWITEPLKVSTDDPAIPTPIPNGEYFQTQPGTYHLEYATSNKSTYNVTYSIYANSGNPGETGENIYFLVSLYSFGPSLLDWDFPYKSQTIGDYTITVEYTETK